MHEDTQKITDIILKAASKARRETRNESQKRHAGKSLSWPIECTIGPGLEGAIACESKIGYVDGSKGWLIYRGYDIFDLCAYSSYEEVSYLLLHGTLPNPEQLEVYTKKLVEYRYLNKTLRMLMSFPVEEMNAMGALRMGTIFMRQEFTYKDQEAGRPNLQDAISADEDSIPMETMPTGQKKAIYEFRAAKKARNRKKMLGDASGLEACYHLLGGVPTITAAISRIRQGHMAIEPDPQLSHAGNFLYMMTGKRPTPVQERIMDVALILHADHGMNASTFASMVVASTLSDIYFSVGSGIAALNGPLHGGANENVLHTLREIGSPENVAQWVQSASEKKKKIPGFGHRVYKAYDPRARVLGPLAGHRMKHCPEEIIKLYSTANELEKQVLKTFGHEKKIFPNVDFYSGIVYSRMGIDPRMFTPIFAVSRIAGWTARVLEYLENNRIFRPRSMYTGDFEQEYVPLEER
jgi:citrate synthase